jgi:hypothetical protein
VTVNIAVAPDCTVIVAGATDNVIAGTVIVTLADFDASATEVPVSVTVRSLAGEAGGAYVVGAPLAVDVGETLPHAATEHDTLQVTPLLAES